MVRPDAGPLAFLAGPMSELFRSIAKAKPGRLDTLPFALGRPWWSGRARTPRVCGIFGWTRPESGPSSAAPSGPSRSSSLRPSERVHGSTIARVAKVKMDGDIYRLLDRIEADGLFVSRMIGNIRLYALASERWTRTLRGMLRAILAQHP